MKAGWDEHLAYMQKLIELSRKGEGLEGLTANTLHEIAAGLEFYPGVPEGLITLRDEIQGTSEFRDAGIRVEFYVISAGIGDMLRASALAEVAHRIWACDFAYDAEGKLSNLKNVISFTDKTRHGQQGFGEEIDSTSSTNPWSMRSARSPSRTWSTSATDQPTFLASRVTAMGGPWASSGRISLIKRGHSDMGVGSMQQFRPISPKADTHTTT